MQKICIIIPCFNEADRLPQEMLDSFLQKSSIFSFLLVNDGSTDDTLDMLHKIAHRNEGKVMVLHFEKNEGKAEAVRKAMLSLSKSPFDYVGFLDADFSAPPAELEHILSFCNGTLTKSFIAASRIKRLGANITRNIFRHYAGRVFATFASFVLTLPVYDSQCGLKIIKHDLIKTLFERPFITKWLFDLEILLRLRNHLGYEQTIKETIEVPLVEWQGKKGSKISFFDFLKAPLDLLKIHVIYNW